MRIERIDFARVGAWSRRSLSFGPGLNIVTGANEAGKSTALRAIEALLFPVAAGGPHGLAELARPLAPGSFDATLHAARGKGAETETIGWRRWGARLEDLQGQPLDPAVMRAWLWEISQQDYRLVYALGHDRLREGGKLLEKDGAVSTIIADLTGGVRGLPELRATLVAQRDAQYLMGGNARRVLNNSLADLREQATKRLRQEQVQEHGRYLSLLNDLETGRADERLKNATLTRYDREIRALAELKYAPPIVAEVAGLTERQRQLAIASTMPSRDWFKRARNLEQAVAEAAAAVQSAEDSYRKTQLALKDRTRSAPVLAASGKIKAALAWSKDFEDYEGKRQAAGLRRDEQLGKLISLLRDIDVSASPDEVVDGAATFRIERARKKTLVEALKAAQSAREETLRAATAVAEEGKRLAERERALASLPEQVSLAPLLDAQALGHVHAAETEAQRLGEATSAAAKHLSRVGARLGFPAALTLDGCVSTPIPAAVQTQALEAAQGGVDKRTVIATAALETARGRESSAQRQLAEAERLLDQTLNRDTLARLRAKRDALEARLVSGGGAGTIPADALHAFGVAIREIDALVDRLLDHAKLVAERDAATRALEAATATVRDAEAELRRCAQDQKDLAARWQALWAASGVTVAIGDARWRQDHDRFLQDVETLGTDRIRADAAAKTASSRRHAVEQVLGLVGLGLAGEALDRRLAEAIDNRRAANEAHRLAVRSVEEAKDRYAKAKSDHVRSDAEKAKTEEYLVRLASDAPALVAGDGDRVEAWIGQLEALDLAAKALREAIDDDERVRARHDQALAAVDQAFATLAAAGIEPGTSADTPALLRLARLSRLLNDAEVTHERESAAARAKTDLDERNGALNQALERLAMHLGAATGEPVAPGAQAIHEIMQRLAEYYDLDEKIAEKKAAACRDRDFGWEALVEKVEGRDVAALDADIERIEAQKEIVTAERDALGARIAEAEKAIENLTRDGSVAELSQQIERLIAVTADELEEALALYGAVALLEQVEAQLSEDARLAGLLDAASLHFARLTRGMFTRVEFKDAQRKELVVVRAGAGVESTLDPQALSDGTRDQLWLALRLALIEPHLSAKRLPLVLDDILVHFDPARTTAALEALAEIARHTQVILFTHHPHVVELAHAAGLAFESLDLPAREALGPVPPREALDPALPRPRAIRPRPTPPADEAAPGGGDPAPRVPPDDRTLSADARFVLAALAARDDQRAGNLALRRELDWTEERYDHAKAELIARGFVVVGAGRGGSVRLAPAEGAAAPPAAVDDA
jgi:uncharacterized protein YhaN